MHPKRIEIQKRLRLLVPIGIALEVLSAIGLWIAYFYIASGDESTRGRGTFSQPYPWLAFAILATFVAPPFLFFAYRNYVWLLQNGTEIQGYVKSVSALSHSGSRPVTFVYQVNGVEHSIKRDITNTTANSLSPGSPVLMLVDPAKPKRVTFLDMV